MTRAYQPAEITHLQARSGVRSRLFVWIGARDRVTGAPVAVGFSNCADDQVITINGETRTYHGAGPLLGMDDLVIEPGVRVRRMSVWLATAAPEVVNAVMGYDVRLAPVQIHRLLTDPLSHQPISATPHRIWKGQVDGAPRVIPAKGLSGGKITLVLASAAIVLTKGLPAKYSDAAMKKRGGDRLFRYADVSGKVPVFWGEKKFEAPAPKPKPTPGSNSGRPDSR